MATPPPGWTGKLIFGEACTANVFVCFFKAHLSMVGNFHLQKTSVLAEKGVETSVAVNANSCVESVAEGPKYTKLNG
jgi:hypothetical protein